MPNIGTRLQHAWNAFVNGTDEIRQSPYLGTVSTYRPDKRRFNRGIDRTIVTSIYERLSVDAASIDIKHVRLDEDGRYLEDLPTGLNYCLTMSANADQSGRAFLQDVYASMLDEGVVAIIPVETDFKPSEHETYRISQLRTGKITEWYPKHVRVNAYDERTGQRTDIIVPKATTAIVQNPFYATMNEPNSMMQRLIRKLSLLDVIDEQSGQGKLDLIIQLPYTLKTEQKRKQAEERRRDIEMQLSGTKYGIAYTDATEHITQLNRSLDNNLMDQIKYLMELVYSQLGLTVEIMNGTANEDTMTNYYTRIIETMVVAVVEEMRRTFLTDAARSRRQSILYFRDPFKLTSASKIAEMADKFTRNEIMSSNEVRQKIGIKPSEDPAADELRNKNLNAGEDQDYARSSAPAYEEE